MTAPTFVTASTGATDAGGAWSHTCAAPGAAGRLIIVQILQDGISDIWSSQSTLTGTNITSLTGTSNQWNRSSTPFAPASAGVWSVGSAAALQGFQVLYFGRSTGTSAPTISGANSTSEDLYIRAYEFADVSTGTTFATVVENVNAGESSLSRDTSATASDASVQTLGTDRLALNLLGIADDNPFAGFTGETGGTWTTRASYAEASGTDGAIYLITAPMASSGTINGGTGSITDSDGWGAIGFALIGTSAAGTSVNAGVATGTGTSL